MLNGAIDFGGEAALLSPKLRKRKGERLRLLARKPGLLRDQPIPAQVTRQRLFDELLEFAARVDLLLALFVA